MKSFCLQTILVLWSISAAAGFDFTIDPKYAQNSHSSAPSLPIDISSLRNNRGFGSSPSDANYNGFNAAYPADFLPPSELNYAGVDYIFPQYQSEGNDNVLAQGQSLTFPPGRYASVEILAAAENGFAKGTINASYTDSSTSSSSVRVAPYWHWPYPYGGDIIFPYYLGNQSIDYNRSMIYHSSHWVDTTKTLSSLKLPDLSDKEAGSRLHIFAVSMVPAVGKGLELEVLFARSTQTWLEDTNKTQIFEASISNSGTEWILADDGIELTVEADGLKTVSPGKIHRLRPGDQVRVQIGVVNDGAIEGSKGSARLCVSGKGVDLSHNFDATFGIGTYEPTYESIYAHESPPWFNNGKFGIFIHWGVYAVPGWGNVGDNEGYAEWYWWDMNDGPDTKTDTYDYHAETYGKDVVYDDFIANFTADAYDPKEWVDLFADAGAQYFVLTSKHHDGYALFDLPAEVTQRTSVALSPHRDLLQELFDAAEEHQPHLHRSTYFSLPEWFHPDYAGFNKWPGGNALNAYTNATLPYTGYVPVDDFVHDVIGPEMQALANAGTEILWCDIGGANMTAEFAASYFNDMAAQGKQVLLNNRCGTPGDFDTPEYARYDTVQARKWESNLGMDPYSYGYNRATPEDEYMTANEVVTTLVDIVSKNGNFLLDIGPMANGML